MEVLASRIWRIRPRDPGRDLAQSGGLVWLTSAIKEPSNSSGGGGGGSRRSTEGHTSADRILSETTHPQVPPTDPTHTFPQPQTSPQEIVTTCLSYTSSDSTYEIGVTHGEQLHFPLKRQVLLYTPASAATPAASLPALLLPATPPPPPGTGQPITSRRPAVAAAKDGPARVAWAFIPERPVPCSRGAVACDAAHVSLPHPN